MAVTRQIALADLTSRLINECLDGEINFGNMVHAIQRTYQDDDSIRNLMPTMDEVFALCVKEIEKRAEPDDDESIYLLGVPKSMLEEFLPPNMMRVRTDTVEVEPVGAPIVHGVSLERIDIGELVEMNLDNGHVRLRRAG